MWGRKIIYLLFVMITSYVALMYEGAIPGMLLAFELLLPFVLFAVSWYLKYSVRVRIGRGAEVADCDETVEIPLVFENRGFLPITDASVRVIVSNCLDGEKESYDLNLRAPAKTKLTVPFSFRSTYCGVVTVQFEQVMVYDYLRLFQRRVRHSQSAECIIMPHLLDLQVKVTDRCRSYDSDSEEYDKNRPGDDPAEIYQIREFRQGDKMSRVHWKMTARLDEMMIKELSRPISNSVGIYLDLRYETMEEIQSVYDLCYSLSVALCLQECHHRLIWHCQEAASGFEEYLIRNIDDITEAMSKLLVSASRAQKLFWREYCQSKDTPLYRMIAVSGVQHAGDPELDAFMEADGTVKSVLTIDGSRELIEI